MSSLLPIVTPRLILRDFVERDLDAIYVVWSDPEVTRWTDYAVETRYEAGQWLESVIYHNRTEPRLIYNLAIVLDAEDEVVGWIGIGPPAHLEAEAGTLSVGFCLRCDCWGRGLMTEALRALVGFAFGRLGAQRVLGQCYPQNVASGRVMEKAGMRFEIQASMPGGDGEIRPYRRYGAVAPAPRG